MPIAIGCLLLADAIRYKLFANRKISSLGQARTADLYIISVAL